MHMRGYDEMAQHMLGNIDLREKSVIFTPSIRDAEALTQVLAPSLGAMGHQVRAIHSESSDTDESILSQFRDPTNSLSVLVSVDKLNR